MKKLLKIILCTLGIAILLIGLGTGLAAVFFDWNRLQGPIIQVLNERSGRTVEINGDIDVDLSMTPQIGISGITLSNADWARNSQMFKAEKLAFSIRLRELLHRRVVLPEIILTKPEIDLERNAANQANWVFDEGVIADAAVPDDRGSFPIIGRLIIEDGRMQYRDANRDFDFVAQLASIRGKGRQPGAYDESISVKAKGQAQGKPLDMTLIAGSLIDLRDEDQLYPVDFKMVSGDTHIALKGHIDQPLALRGLDLTLQLRGPNLERLYALTGIPLPDSPPYQLTGKLQHTTGKWRVQSLAGSVGDSDISGNLEVHTADERLTFIAELESSLLDFDDLGPFIGMPPSTGKGETVSEEQAQQAAAQKQSSKMIPDDNFDLTKLREADAQVKLRAKKVLAPDLPIDDLFVDLQLKDGVLKMQPLKFGLANGELDSQIVMDANEEKIKWDYDVKLREFRLDEFMRSQTLKDAVGGQLGGRIQMSSVGNSMHETAANGNGRMEMVLAGGRLSNLAIELIGLDVAESLGLLISGSERSVPLRCAVGDLIIEDGQLSSRILVVDTSDTRINGELAANLETERFQLRIEPKPKDPSLFSSRTPINVQGSFKDISVRPDVGNLALRTGAAVALGTIATPAAALLAFLEPGLGEDADCAGLLASKRAEQKLAQ